MGLHRYSLFCQFLRGIANGDGYLTIPKNNAEMKNRKTVPNWPHQHATPLWPRTAAGCLQQLLDQPQGVANIIVDGPGFIGRDQHNSFVIAWQLFEKK